MLKPSTLTFLKQIKNPKNNSKTWVDEHREQRDQAVDDAVALADRLLAEVAKFDERIAHARLNATECVTRLNRDVRFHGGPSFKHELNIVLNARGKKRPGAYYYLHVEPGNCCVGGGVYLPETAEAKRIREAIAADGPAFKKLIGGKTFKSRAPAGLHAPSKLKSVPKDFDAEDPAAEYLKFKGFFTREPLTDRQMADGAAFKKIVGIMKASAPLVEFLNEAMKSGPTGRAERGTNPQYPR